MTEPGGPRPRRDSRWIGVGLVLLVWTSRAVFPGDIAYSNLDRSWCLGLGHALLSGWRAGIDWVFTFGPLGFFSTAAYLPELFWTKVLVWEGAFGLLCAVAIAQAGLGIESRLLRLLYFLLILVQPIDPDAQAFLAIAAALAWIARPAERRAPAIAVGAAVIAGLAFVKFTYLAAGAVAVLAAAAILLRSGARRAALASLLATAGFAAGAWLLAGQRFFDLPVYLARSAELAGGYSQAMSLAGSSGAIATALALLALAALAAAIHARPLSALAQLALLGIAYKAGFVRADHAPTFFLFAILAPFYLVARDDSTALARRASAFARVACAGLGILGLRIGGGVQPGAVPSAPTDAFHRTIAHARALLRPGELRSRLAAVDAEEDRWLDLPRTRGIVGRRTIDAVPFLQVALFANGLEWRPRPVFQSYACLTPGLQELNARFLESGRAPDFLLLRLETIDHRLPALDDALALPVIARDYAPVLAERTFLLLERRPRPASATEELSVEREYGFEEPIDMRNLPGEAHLLALDVRFSLAGRVRTLLDAAPPLFAQIDLDDGLAVRVRIVPAMARSGVLVDPALLTQRDWIAWCEGEPVHRPVRMRLLRPKSDWAFEPRFRARISRCDSVVPHAAPIPDVR